MALKFSYTLEQLFFHYSGARLPNSLGQFAKSGATGQKFPYYDLFLTESRSGPFAICFMKLQFAFALKSRDPDIDKEIEQAGRSSTPWSDNEAKRFIDIWQSHIAVWNTKSLTSSPARKPVALQFHFQTYTPSHPHWTIEVTKLKPGAVVAGAVVRSQRMVYLNNNELIPDEHPRQGQKQRGSVHEFAHMLGLHDDYYKEEEAKRNPSYRHLGTKYAKDYASVTNRGETVMPRHLEAIRIWVDGELKRWAQHAAKAAS